MSVSNLPNTVTVTAGEAIPIYRFMQLQADGKYDVADDAQGAVHGVSAEAAAADGDAIAMALPMGIMKIEAGAVTTLGGAVASDATGRAIDHVTTAGNTIAGYFLDAAGAAGDIVRVQVMVMQDGA
jgi:hypothetical protein